MSEVQTFVSNPVVIEARKFDGDKDQALDIVDWILENNGDAAYFRERESKTIEATPGKPKQIIPSRPAHIRIDTLEGNMVADIGDWIIKGTQGEFYPCKDSVFRTKYSPVETA